MKKGCVKNIVIKTFAWILLIQILNTSIDPIARVSEKQQCLTMDEIEQDEDDEIGLDNTLDFYLGHSPIEITKERQILQPSFLIKEKNLTSVILENTSPPPRLS